MYKYLDHQWTDDYRRPFIVKVDDQIAGFALVIIDVPREFTKLSSAEKTNVISDFFIMRKYRRKGIGKKVAFSLFKEFRGVWEVKQTHSNKKANIFWKNVIREYTSGDEFKEKWVQNESWNGPVMVFQS